VSFDFVPARGYNAFTFGHLWRALLVCPAVYVAIAPEHEPREKTTVAAASQCAGLLDSHDARASGSAEPVVMPTAEMIQRRLYEG
jgi:hypothetical protein